MRPACLPRHPAVAYLRLVRCSCALGAPFFGWRCTFPVASLVCYFSGTVYSCGLATVLLLARINWYILARLIRASALDICFLAVSHFWPTPHLLCILRAVHRRRSIATRRTKTHPTSNQSMKPTAPFRNTFNVIATTPYRGLPPSR